MKCFNLQLLTILVCFLFLTGQHIAAQNTDTNMNNTIAYQKGEIFINGGFSLGAYYWGAGEPISFAIPFSVAGEYTIENNFSIGGFMGYGFRRYRKRISIGNATYKYSWHLFSIGARGSFHYIPFMNEHFETNINPAKWDLYLTMLVGIRNRFGTGTNVSYIWETHDRYTVSLIFNPILGGKYYISDNLSIFAETGNALFGFLTIGASYDF